MAKDLEKRLPACRPRAVARSVFSNHIPGTTQLREPGKPGPQRIPEKVATGASSSLLGPGALSGQLTGRSPLKSRASRPQGDRQIACMLLVVSQSRSSARSQSLKESTRRSSPELQQCMHCGILQGGSGDTREHLATAHTRFSSFPRSCVLVPASASSFPRSALVIP